MSSVRDAEQGEDGETQRAVGPQKEISFSCQDPLHGKSSIYPIYPLTQAQLIHVNVTAMFLIR